MGAFDELFKEEFEKMKAEVDQFMTAQQIYDNFDQARGTGSLQNARHALEEVERQYTMREHDITKLAASMEEGWTGEAAGAAQRGAGPMAVEHGHAAQALATAKDLLQNQSDTFHDTKSKVVQIPPYPDQDQYFRDVLTGHKDTAMTRMMSYYGALEGNVQAMNAWTSSSNHNAGMMPGSYGNIDPHALNVSTGPAKGGGGGGKKPGGGPGGPGPGGGLRGGSPGLPPNHGPGTGSGGAGGGSGHGIAEPPGWGKPGKPGSEGENPGKGIGDTGNRLPDDSTTPGSYDPASFKSGTSDPAIGGWRPGAASALGGFGPGSGGGDSTSAGGGFIAGGPGGPGGPNAGALAGGKATGGGAVGGAQGTRPGGTAAPGAKGAAGGAQGMMGAGAGKGKSEDEEHKRKYGVAEDGIFAEVEGDEKEVDPRTGWAPTQPVIGQ
ncbi:hypothetical protein [Amycolatopsis sp. CA-230715]|uniref:hypothetical protein n=1 Tax=Amycolatopsis sp. CA-230715 TaxID=2745196 RepID=UPI001C03858D|nr:hypothetical protein [Amycolatopsis sp. CA-230715]QWF81798.1 hypothetical protein HUW46_05231 [Amycolatopsis sp. CA-230715]